MNATRTGDVHRRDLSELASLWPLRSLAKFQSLSFVVRIGLLVATIVSMPSYAQAQGLASRGSADNKLASPGSRYLGKTYGAWSAEHWKWLFSLPVDQHPLLDTADIDAGQSGPVWFLGGTLASSELTPGVIVGEADRVGEVPLGKSLFFPMVSIEGSLLEGNGTNAEELRDYANFFADFIDPATVYLIIDGKPVRQVERLRAESPLFTFGPLPANNVFQIFGADIPAGTTSQAVSDGYWAMVKPLTRGTHTLEFGGVIDLTSIDGPMFIQDIRYTIHVVPDSHCDD